MISIEVVSESSLWTKKIKKPPWVLLILGNVYFRNERYDKAKKLINESLENFNLLEDYIEKNFGVLPENTNFGIKTSVVKSMLNSSDISLPNPNKNEISKSQLGKNISNATYYLSCWMTMAQIEKTKSNKVIFKNLEN